MHAFNGRFPIGSTMSALMLILLMLVISITWGADSDENADKGAVNPFANGWKLDASASSIVFQTVSNAPDSDDSTLENHSFDTFEGTVDETGIASLRIQLDSVDTKDDLRNVRLRFLFFETYKFGEAVVSAKINPEALSTLAEKDKIEVPLEFELDFHGVKQSLKMQTNVVNLADNKVSVASVDPVSIETSMFDLNAADVKKLEDSSNQSIVPMAAVSFDLIFDTSTGSVPGNEAESEDTVAEGNEADGDDAKGSETEGDNAEGDEAEGDDAEGKEAEGDEAEGNDAEGDEADGDNAEGDDAEGEGSDAEDTASADVSAQTDDGIPEVAVPVAVEVEITTDALAIAPDAEPESTPYLSPYSEPKAKAGDLSDEQCAKRFEEFSKSGGIYFKSSSAELDPKSVGVLSAIVEVANRCSQFKLTVAGHTDSTGSRKSNQKLSEQRALSVSKYLINNNVDRERLSAVGFGETKPLVPNDTRRNRERNRRIEFSVAN